MVKLSSIPITLVGFRFLIAFLLCLDALDYRISDWFVTAYIIAVISDIFDGIIARRLGVSTVRLRQADSWADICLYVAISTGAWLVYPQVIISLQVPLLLALAAQISLFTISLIKFKKFPSFHTYTAKIWGVTLLIATVSLFQFSYINTIWLAIALCWINSLEEIVMTLILTEWHCDVLSIFHAIKLQQSVAETSLNQKCE